MKLYLGGSPCTHWSIAQTKDRETKPEGIGWELFLNYLIGLEKYNPRYFLYENNKSMAPAIREQITRELGVEPILINSALVSAQNRQRLYWTNIPGVTQPEDKGILLRDVLESGMAYQEKAYCLTATEWKGSSLEHNLQKHVRTQIAEPVRIGTIESAVPLEYEPLHSCDVVITDKNIRCTYKDGTGTAMGYSVYFDDVKSPSVIAGHANKMKVIERATGIEKPVYEVRDGLITIKGKQYPIKLLDGFYIIRKLTVTECKRLQTVPDSYIFPVSDTQAYKMLGNGWTVDVIAHILQFIPGIATEPLEVLSMYDGMSCGHIALDKLGANVVRYYATEIDKYAIQTTQANYPDTIQLGDAFQVRDDMWSLEMSNR